MDADGHLSGYDWVKIFVGKLLQITHSQWIFRNMTLHDKNGGELRQREAQKMRTEAATFAQTNPMKLREQDHWLLELDGQNMPKGTVTTMTCVTSLLRPEQPFVPAREW